MPCFWFVVKEDSDLSDADHATGADGDGSLEGPGRIGLVIVV